MQPCPRQRDEATLQTQISHKSHWESDGTCSYCGSLSPDLLFAAIESGCELGPTDKNYKVYVDRPDPDAGIPWVYASANFKHEGEGWREVTKENLGELKKTGGFDIRFHPVGHWVQVSPKNAIQHNKFYFQHLNTEERKKFVQLLNDQKIKIGMPGYFYRLPFFIKKETKGVDHVDNGSGSGDFREV